MNQADKLCDLLLGKACDLCASLQREVLYELSKFTEFVGVRLDETVVDPVVLDQHVGDRVHKDQIGSGL